jgi:RNA polymerase-binding transcription factor DksA
MSLDPTAIRKRLDERRRQLYARYRGAIDRVAEELDSREIEQVENSNELWDARFLSVMSDSDAHALQQVIGALVRLDEGAYGVCLECGEPIDERRLEVVPETLYCAADADKKEAEARPKAPPAPLA